MELRLIRETLGEIMSGTLRMVDQDTELATWEPSLDGVPRLFRPELAKIGWAIGYMVAKQKLVRMFC